MSSQARRANTASETGGGSATPCAAMCSAAKRSSGADQSFQRAAGSAGLSRVSGASHFGLALAPEGVARAPSSIHARSVARSAAESGSPPRGMRGAVWPVTRWINRLCALSPGRTAAPLRPPFRVSA